MEAYLIVLALVLAYGLGLFALVRSGRMEKWNLSLFLGFILMIRTQRGRGLLKKISTPKKFWNAFGDVGIVVTMFGMVLMAVLMVWVTIQVLKPSNQIQSLGISEILVIPGVNPFVPLWYGIIALIVTLVVHEGGHGILSLSNGLRVKSLGLLFAIVPIGAFVEPDENDLTETSRRNRLRVYSAGPMVNIVVALITVLAMAALLGAATPIEGTAITAVGGPAAEAGLIPGDIIAFVDDVGTPNIPAFRDYFDGKSPGDSVQLLLADGSTLDAVLGSRWDSLSPADQQRVLAENATFAEELQQTAYLGVGMADQYLYQDAISHPFASLTNFAYLVGMPIQEVRSTPVLGFILPEFTEAPFSPTIFWILVNTTFWIFWINLMVGLTNILPLLPLDGGHMFRDSMAGIFEKFRPGATAASREAMVSVATRLVGFTMFFAIILQFFGPRLVQLFT